MNKNAFLQFLKNKKIITKDNNLGKKYKKILNHDIETLQRVIEFTSFLQYDAPISVRLHCIIKNISYQPMCKTCKKPLKMRTSGKVRYTFGNFCGGACISKHPTTRMKCKLTNLKRYGVEHTFQSKEFKKATKISMIEKYGVEHAAQSPIIQERMKQTNLERYGVEHASQSPVIQEKIKQTCLKRFGVESPFQSPEIQEKKNKS